MTVRECTVYWRNVASYNLRVKMGRGRTTYRRAIPSPVRHASQRSKPGADLHRQRLETSLSHPPSILRVTETPPPRE